jgi:hypothetical protein
MSLRKNIVDKDAKFLAPHESELEALVASHPFSKRIRHLIENPSLSVKKVSTRFNGEATPNPLGTALYLAEINEMDHPYCGLSPEIIEHMQDLAKEGRPGYFVLSPKREMGSRDAEPYDVNKRHVGIYIGKIDGREVVFSQQGVGGIFGFELLSSSYVDYEFYMPTSLAEKEKPRKK